MRPRLLAILLALCAWPSPAHADDATEAKLRFDRAVAFINEGKVRRALDEFFVSNRLSPNPTATYNISACLEALKRHEEAFSSYSAYLETFALSEEERQSGRDALKRILRKVARISVTSTPPGAAIYFDRTNLGQYGVTPRTLAHNKGKRTVIVQLPGYIPHREKVVLKKGKEVRLDVQLKPIETDVLVTSDPPGASIRLGSATADPIGETPSEVRLAVGERVLFLDLENFEPERKVVQVLEGEGGEVKVTLRKLPAAKGRLRVLTNVPNALVRVDGEAAGYTPLVIELAGGDHGLSVVRKGYTPWTGPVGIVPDRPLVADVTLRPTDPPDPLQIWKWVMGATGTTTVLLGAVTGLQARRVASDFRATPTRAGYDEVGQLNTAADMFFGVGLITGVATLALVFGADPPSSVSTADVAHADAEK